MAEQLSQVRTRLNARHAPIKLPVDFSPTLPISIPNITPPPSKITIPTEMIDMMVNERVNGIAGEMMNQVNNLTQSINILTQTIQTVTQSINDISKNIIPQNAIDSSKIYSNKEIPTKIGNRTFSLNQSPYAGSEHIYINGLLIQDGVSVDYTIADNVIIFDENVPVDTKIVCTYYYFLEESLQGYIDREIPIGNINGENNTYNLSRIPLEGTEHVYLNGLLQEKGVDADYTLTGTTLTFAYSPLEDSLIQCTYKYSIAPPTRVLSYKEIPQGNINGTNTTFVLDFAPAENSEHVYLNGLLQEKDLDYVVEGKNIIFNLPVRFGNKLTCTYYYYLA